MAEKKEQGFSEKDEEKENLYTEEGAEEQLEDDEITAAEAGFMEGYDRPKLVECKSCANKVDFEKVIERKVNGETLWFCSLKCAEHYEKRKALG